MKIKIVYTILLLNVCFSCSITEDPVFFSGETLFDNSEGANAVLNGLYATANNSYNNGYPQMIMGSSGLMGINTLPFATTIGSLQPNSTLTLLEEAWRTSYATIGCANDLIYGLLKTDFPDETEKNNILGQGYFVRAWQYFNMVRIWGPVSLITEPATVETVNPPRSPIEEVYLQIISDAGKAAELMKDVSEQNVGYPGKQAANMLLAQVYMAMAENQKSTETDYWQKAYDQAIQAYQKYSLVSDVKSLWNETTGDNTVESVFEMQGNATYGSASRWERIFSASNSNAGRNMYGRMWANLEAYDSHVTRYPGDPRIDATFITSHIVFNASGVQSTQTTYPKFTSRGNANRSFPRLYKYFVKDINKDNYTNNKNLLVFRYSELLLMLAEIENELHGPDNAYPYVNAILKRARESVTPAAAEPADWTGLSQDDFRQAIMKEYIYELLGEGEDYYLTRRRGYNWFKINVIDAHNNHPKYDFSKDYDNRYPDNDRIMLLPIPSAEISANGNINASDQNPGY